MQDLISRYEAIDGLEGHYIERINLNDWQSGWNAAIDWMKDVYLDELSSAQPEPQWIPVSERLPESKHEDLEYPTVIACCEDGEVMTACYYESTKEWGIEENYDRKINPVAWMPLPEPYRAERRTDEGD